MIFAKLYETEKYGQILVKLDQSNDNGAEIRFYAQPEGLGVCSVAVSYGDEDADWDFAEEVFAKITQQEAEVRVQPIFQLVGEREGNGGEMISEVQPNPGGANADCPTCGALLSCLSCGNDLRAKEAELTRVLADLDRVSKERLADANALDDAQREIGRLLKAALIGVWGLISAMVIVLLVHYLHFGGS